MLNAVNPGWHLGQVTLLGLTLWVGLTTWVSAANAKDDTSGVETSGVETSGVATPLKTHSRLQRLYLEHAAPLSGTYTAQNIAVVMLFARHAREKNLRAFNHRLAADLLPIFEQEPTLFLNQLMELPSLTGPVCDRLAAYFEEGYSGNRRKSDFLAQHHELLRNTLPAAQLAQCEIRFERNDF